MISTIITGPLVPHPDSLYSEDGGKLLIANSKQITLQIVNCILHCNCQINEPSCHKEKCGQQKKVAKF